MLPGFSFCLEVWFGGPKPSSEDRKGSRKVTELYNSAGRTFP